MNWSRFVPLVRHLREYSWEFFRQDTLAGITVAIMLIPQGMAYALLAGMPPIYGLYGALVPMIVYGLLGTSRQLSIGPVAISALLLLAGISQVAEPQSETYIALVILSGLLIGASQLAMSLLRLGFLANLLSHPVIMGFTSAAAIIIATSQLSYLFGFEIPRFDHVYETMAYAFTHLGDIHWLSFMFCGGSIAVLMILRRISRRIPGPLLVILVTTILTQVFQLDKQDLAVLGAVPAGLPAFQVPSWGMDQIQVIATTVLTVTIIQVVESLSIAKALEMKNKDTKVRPNQELLALGVAKILGSFFQALPSSASFSRSAVNNEAGAKTGLSSLVGAVLTGLALVFFTPWFYYIPEASLAAIILVAVGGLLEVQGALKLWKEYRWDFYMMMITFLVTLAISIQVGVLTGVILSLLVILFRSSRPHAVILGQLPDTRKYRNIKRYPQAIQHSGVVILRFDAPLYFINAEFFKDIITRTVHRQEEPLKLFILDASSILDMDSGGAEALREVSAFLERNGITLYLTGVIGPVRDQLYRTGMDEELGRRNQFMYIGDAVEYFHKQTEGKGGWSADALQNNVYKEGKRPPKTE